jgi:hypothetical protein
MADKVEPKILILDIEWKPTKAYVWRAWDENIGPDQIIEHGGLLCIGVMWLKDNEVTLYSEWEHGHDTMVKRAHEWISEADAIVTYNGDKYDLPKLQGEFLLAGLAPPPPPTSIDVLKAVKKLGFFMNRLGFIGPFLGVGGKVEHEGIKLWQKVEAGDVDAQSRMAKYCKQDVAMLKKLYLKVLPYIKNHPFLGERGRGECGNCGGQHLQSRGFRRTKAFKIQRLQCQTCGSWQDGTRTKVV